MRRLNIVRERWHSEVDGWGILGMVDSVLNISIVSALVFLFVMGRKPMRKRAVKPTGSEWVA